MLSLVFTRLRELPRTQFCISWLNLPVRISRNSLFWLVLLPFLAVTKSFADTLPNFSALVESEGDAVVKVSVRTESPVSSFSGFPGFDLEQLPEPYRRFFEQLPQGPDGGAEQGSGFGSGFIIDKEGYIITNAHVVADAVDITVSLNDRREMQAQLIGSDPTSDIAVLKIDGNHNLPVVKMGNSDKLKVGEWVLAIGSPFGFEHTATQGIVSALSRSLPDGNYVPFIQTDVAVNPGNSGGPLFNTEGEVIGVNSQIYSRSGGYQGLSFAIPMNVAMSIAGQLRENGYATRGWLGVRIQNVDQSLADSFGLAKPEGALVSEVTDGSPAAKAKLLPGDIILTFNGKAVPLSSALPPIVGAVKPGSNVPVEVLRNGENITIDVTVEALENDVKTAQAFHQNGNEPSNIGANVVDLSEDQLEQLGIPNGVQVTQLDSAGAAAHAGVMEGDIIMTLNRQHIESVSQLEKVLKDAPLGSAMPLLVQRDSSPLFLALTLKE